MEFEWDEDKRLTNIDKHGIDFRAAITIWERPILDPAALRLIEGEIRPTAIGSIGEDEILIAVVYTMRDDCIRLISARRARRHERQYYQDQFGRGR
jgi:uncharacterized DUF497 family protein